MKLWPTPRAIYGEHPGMRAPYHLTGAAQEAECDREPMDHPTQLPLLAEESHANLLLLPGSDEAQRMTVGSGEKLLGLCKRSSHVTSFGKTLLAYLVRKGGFRSSKRYLRWSVKVTPFNRLLFRLVPSTPRISESEYSLWATPRAAESASDNKNEWTGKYMRRPDGSKVATCLTHQVKMWPTPAHLDYRNQHAPESDAFIARQENPRGVNLVEEMQRRGEEGQLNPDWCEWLMNFPVGWTNPEISRESLKEWRTGWQG